MRVLGTRENDAADDPGRFAGTCRIWQARRSRATDGAGRRIARTGWNSGRLRRKSSPAGATAPWLPRCAAWAGAVSWCSDRRSGGAAPTARPTAGASNKACPARCSAISWPTWACGAQVDADSEDVWVRRLVTKNGLQQWVVAFNAGRGTAQDLTLRIPVNERPQRVVDVVSGQHGRVHLARWRSPSFGPVAPPRRGARAGLSIIRVRWRPWPIGSRRNAATRSVGQRRGGGWRRSGHHVPVVDDAPANAGKAGASPRLRHQPRVATMPHTVPAPPPVTPRYAPAAGHGDRVSRLPLPPGGCRRRRTAGPRLARRADRSSAVEAAGLRVLG